MIESYLLSGGVFFLFLLTHALVFYHRRPQEPWKAVSRMAKLFFLVYTLLFFTAPFPNLFLLMADSFAARAAAYANGAVLYIFLFFSYAQVYFLLDRSISGRILTDMFEAGGSATEEEIRRRYDPHALQRRRLRDMVYGGHIKEYEGTFALTPKGKLLARVFHWGKKILHLYPGG